MKSGKSIAREPERTDPGRNTVLSAFSRIGVETGLLLVSALLFALSFPGFHSEWGWFPLAYICLVPMFLVIHRSGWGRIFLYGALFGFTSYALFNYWLGKFHPLALMIVPVIYLGYFLVLFPLLKLADSLFPRYGFLLQAGIWVAYEYLRTLGFLGYPYGILGYSQYLFLPLVRLSSVTGVWGVTLLVVLPSAWLARALRDGPRGIFRFAKTQPLVPAAWTVLFLLSIGYGILAERDLSAVPAWRVALVQQNVDPWRGGLRAYRDSLDRLLRQSRAALREKPEIVIWSETSFVPGIDWHTRYRTDQDRYALVRELTTFLAEQDVPFVIGNDDGQLERNESGELVREDYNATLLYDGGRIVETYRKTHLVPFTEHFPFGGLLTPVRRWLEEADTHFWKKGTEYTVFDAAGVKFSTPICFEDTFGYLSRRFVREGAEVIVNMTNDSWSASVPAAMQHMAMAVFRAAENRRSVVRSTNGGMTTIIDPNGRITSMLPAFTEGYLIGDVPVYTAETSPYTRWGDWFAVCVLILSAGALLAGTVLRVLPGTIRSRH